MATSYPVPVTVLVATDLLAELGDWSEPLEARIYSIDETGRAEMMFRRPVGDEGWRFGVLGPHDRRSQQAWADLRAEVARLEAWKAEAVEVLGQWEQVWEAAGRPGPLGGSKAEAVARMLTERTP